MQEENSENSPGTRSPFNINMNAGVKLPLLASITVPIRRVLICMEVLPPKLGF